VQISILKALKSKTLSRKEIFIAIDMNGDFRFFKRSIEPLIEAGLIEMTIPTKPSSKMQKYRLTDAGKKLKTGK
jgi:predicted transcriptional regulator